MAQKEEMIAYLQKIAATMVTLEGDSHDIFKSIIDRDDNVQARKAFFFKKAKAMESDLNGLRYEMDECDAKIAKLAEIFKSTLKKDKFSQFDDGVEAVPFEFFITHREFDKINNKDQ